MSCENQNQGRRLTPQFVIRRNAAEATTTIRIVPAEWDVETTRRKLAKSAATVMEAIKKTSASLHGWFKSQQAKKRLRVCETVSLGEKRFIAVVEVDGDQFLVGGSSSSVAMLAHLESQPAFAEVLGQRYKLEKDPR